MRRARFLAAARDEHLSEVAYYSEKGVGLGTRFAEAVEEATARVLAFPLSGAPWTKGTRRVIVRGFPFCLVYRPDADGILIFAVAHLARRPDYWARRAEPGPT